MLIIWEMLTRLEVHSVLTSGVNSSKVSKPSGIRVFDGIVFQTRLENANLEVEELSPFPFSAKSLTAEALFNDHHISTSHAR